jgi:hypothetical protein
VTALSRDTRPSADTLNTRLADGGIVQVTTHTRSTIYDRKHAGWFIERNGSLHVRRGKSYDALSIGDRLLVGIRLGWPQ